MAAMNERGNISVRCPDSGNSLFNYISVGGDMSRVIKPTPDGSLSVDTGHSIISPKSRQEIAFLVDGHAPQNEKVMVEYFVDPSYVGKPVLEQGWR